MDCCRMLKGKGGMSRGARRLLGAGLVLAGLAWGMSSMAGAQQPIADADAPKAPAQSLPTVVCEQDTAAAQDEEQKKPWSATVTLNQDSFFGFYPIFNASYQISDKVDFTVYSTLWTNPDFSPFGGGTGLWTEFGAGFQVRLRDDTLKINPQIGVLNGSLLSGANRPLAFEGIVPTMTITHNATWTEGQFYMGYYLATRSPRQNDFLHWWINGGIKPFAQSENWLSILSTGAHFEQLRLTRTRGGNPADIYLWLGPYVQCSFSNNVSIRFTAGWDLADRVSTDFYKVNIGYSF